MRASTVYELKAASAMIGALELWMAVVVGLGSGGDPLSRALDAHAIAGPWALIMAALGFMVLYGAVRPKRKCRHVGLSLSWLLMVAVFGVVAQARLLSMTSGLLLLVAVFCVVLLFMDTVMARTNATAPVY